MPLNGKVISTTLLIKGGIDMEDKLNVYYSKDKNGEVILYANDEKVGTIDGEEKANALYKTIENLIDRSYQAGADRGLLGGGVILIAGGIGWVLLALSKGLTKKVQRYC